jgi:SHS2 domain-containing protein
VEFQLREHTADVAVAATGATLGEVFAAVADGRTAAMCEEIPDSGEQFDLSVTAESREALLFDFLDELIYVRDVENVLPTDHDATVERVTEREASEAGANDRPASGDEELWRVHASARGVPLADVTAREVKAVTYSEMELSETEAGWEAYVVFDV